MQKAKRSGSGGVVVVGGGGPPCGACKFLRRKCVRGCVFAPYFDSEQGAAHFAAVHKVFGASNASKLLLRLPPHRRVEAVVALCYEAVARVRDPVYGCVAHILTLQQQVLKLQTDLAYVQGRLSTFQALIPSPAPARHSQHSLAAHSTETALILDSNALSADPNFAAIFDPVELLQQSPSEIAGFSDQMSDTQQLADAQLQAIAQEFVSHYLPRVKIGPSGSPKSH